MLIACTSPIRLFQSLIFFKPSTSYSAFCVDSDFGIRFPIGGSQVIHIGPSFILMGTTYVESTNSLNALTRDMSIFLRSPMKPSFGPSSLFSIMGVVVLRFLQPIFRHSYVFYCMINFTLCSSHSQLLRRIFTSSYAPSQFLMRFIVVSHFTSCSKDSLLASYMHSEPTCVGFILVTCSLLHTINVLEMH